MSRQNRFFERPNNLLPYIPFWRAALFAPWRSQKSVRKREDPITDNSFIFRDRQLFHNHQIMSVNKKIFNICSGRTQFSHFVCLLLVISNRFFSVLGTLFVAAVLMRWK